MGPLITPSELRILGFDSFSHELGVLISASGRGAYRVYVEMKNARFSLAQDGESEPAYFSSLDYVMNVLDAVPGVEHVVKLDITGRMKHSRYRVQSQINDELVRETRYASAVRR